MAPFFLVAGPGFENFPQTTTKRLKQLTIRNYEQFKKGKVA